MIQNSVKKIISLLLIIGLNWTGILAIGQTLASFNDTENSVGNVLSAGSLDFSLSSSQDNFGPRPEVALNMMPGDSVTREIQVKNEGSLPFQYKVYFEKISGDDDFCQSLQLMAKLDGEIKYDGSLMNFNLSGPIIFSDPEDDWFFVIYLPYESNFVNKICQFKFVFGGWQDNIESYEESGFSDIEEITSHLASWGLRINEVYYDVAPDKGNEGHTANPDEWIELYNPTNQDINVKDWTITDNTCSRTINANINIPAGGFAVVSKDASTWAPGTGYWILPAGTTKIILGQNIGNGLANDGDRVILSRFDGLEIDAVSYGTDTYAFVPACSDVDEGHSL
ncbi:MAG: TasA family protein, partial [Candidatus Helarchaeota archaeon]